MPGRATTETALSEQAWQQRILDTAALYGWRCHHVRPARTNRGWRSPVQGNPGFPDLVLARAGTVLCIELKAQRGRLGPGQADWLEQLGDHGRLYRPSDWPVVLEELSA